MYNITHPWPLYVRSVPQKYHSWELKPCLLRFWTLKLHPQGNGLVILDTLHNQRNPVPDQNHMGQQKQILERGYEWVPSYHSPTSWSPFQREVDLRSLVGSAHNSPLRWLIRCQTLSECPPDLERCSRRLPPSLLCPTPAQRLHKTTNHERKAAACIFICVVSHVHVVGTPPTFIGDPLPDGSMQSWWRSQDCVSVQGQQRWCAPSSRHCLSLQVRRILS